MSDVDKLKSRIESLETTVSQLSQQVTKVKDFQQEMKSNLSEELQVNQELRSDISEELRRSLKDRTEAVTVLKAEFTKALTTKADFQMVNNLAEAIAKITKTYMESETKSKE